MAHDFWVNPFHVRVLLGKHVQVVCEEGGDRFPKFLGQIFPILSTFVGSLSSTGRSTRSSMGPVVASSSDDLGSMVSSRGPSLGGH